MFRKIACRTVAAVLAGWAGSASADVINFDDLATDEDFLQVPEGYEGFTWGADDWGTLDDGYYNGTWLNS